MELITKETNSTSNAGQSAVISQLVEVSWKATRGLVEQTENQVDKLVSQLADAGKISSEERTKLSALINARMADSRKQFLDSIDTHVRTAVEKLVQLNEEEVTRLQTTVANLERKISARA